MKKAILKSGIALAATLLAATGANAVNIFYQQGFSNNLYKYDTVANVETLVGNMGIGADSTGLAFSSTGTLYAFERVSQSLFTVNTTTGAATLVGNAGVGAEDLTIVGNTGYITGNSGLYSLNLSTGAATLIGGGPTMDGLTTAPIAVTVVGSNYAAGSIFGVDTTSIYSINPVTGVGTLLGSSAGANETFDFGPDGTLYGHNSNGQLFTIDLATLAPTLIFRTTPDLVFGMAVEPGAAVPEPATWALMILGFGFVGASMRTRRVRIAFG